MLIILFLLIAFFLGSIPFSYIIGKWVKGIDLRDHGSGNLGATNVFRTLGAGWGAVCLALDIGKGAGAVALMTWLVNSWPEGQVTPFHITPDLFRIIAGFLAALGHTFSPFMGFHGGKGVATTAGAFAVLQPFAILATTIIFVIVFLVTRIVSLGSIVAAIVLPLFMLFFEWQSLDASKTIIIFAFIICGWVVFKHRANIGRLRDGTEGKLESNGTKPEEPGKED
jgi:glycerol-3-phosphate acyltransferase PlsY